VNTLTPVAAPSAAVVTSAPKRLAAYERDFAKALEAAAAAVTFGAMARAIQAASETYSDMLPYAKLDVATKPCPRCDGQGWAHFLGGNRPPGMCYRCAGAGTVPATRAGAAALNRAHADHSRGFASATAGSCWPRHSLVPPWQRTSTGETRPLCRP